MFLKLITKVVLLAIFAFPVFSQDVNVDHYKGTAVATVPLWEVSDGNLRYPITLVNVGNGLSVDGATGELGSGWKISSGSISRVLKGIPDDYMGTVGAITRYGWLRGSTGSLINSFNPTADDDLVTCIDEKDDFNFLNSLGGFSGSGTIRDTEPDIFYIEVPGFSGSFVFDQTGNIQLIDKTDCQITASFSTGNQLEGFTVVDQNGTTYVFGRPFSMSIQTLSANFSAISHFQNEYFLYKDKITFNTSWNLTSIENSEGNKINFTYFKPLIPVGFPYPSLKGSNSDSIFTFLYSTSTFGFRKDLQYVIQQTWDAPNQLIAVSSREQFLQFDYVTRTVEQGTYDLVQLLLNSVSVYNTVNRNKDKLIRKFEMKYNSVGPVDLAPQKTNIFLSSLVQRTEDRTLSPMKFEYYGVDFANATIIVRNRQTTAKDEFNFPAEVPCCSGPLKTFVYPSLSKPDKIRTTPIPNFGQSYYEINSVVPVQNLARIMAGSLKRIVLPKGGAIRMRYELKTYLDQYSQTELYGGGLRISSVEIHDGISFNNDIIKRFEYKRADGKSSGVLISRPERMTNWSVYFDKTNNTTLHYSELMSQGYSEENVIKRTLVVTELPFNKQTFSEVGYSRVTEQVVGKGRSEYDFDVSGAYGTISTTDWNATKTKVARQIPNTTNPIIAHDLGPVNGYYSYPFAPQPNYHFRRGLLKAVQHYDNNNYLTEQITYQYVNSNVPIKVYGIKLGKSLARISYPSPSSVNMFVYSKYEINTNVVPLIKQIDRKSFDRNSNVLNVMTSTKYEYGNPLHSLPTKVITANSDGVEYVQRTLYPKDFQVTGTWSQMDEMCKAITKLKEKNLIAVPIESISEKKLNGSTYTIGAHLTLFNYEATIDRLMVSKSLNFNPGSPVTTFVQSSVSNSGSSTFTFSQPSYTRFTSYSNHSSQLAPQSIVSYNKSKAGIHLIEPHGMPKLAIKHALANEVRYTDFEKPTAFEFTHASSSTVQDGRFGSSAFNLLAGSANKISATITKGNDKINIFSIWIKSSTSANMTVRILDGVHSAVSSVLNIASTNGQWKYFSTSLNVSTMNSQFSIEIESSAPVMIDDMAFYPLNAQIESYLYNDDLLKIAETDLNGISSSFEYDAFNRLITVRDFEGNILKTNTYEDFGPGSQLFPVVRVVEDGGLSAGLNNGGWPGHNVTNGVVCKWKIMSFSDFTSSPLDIDNFSNAIIVNNDNKISYSFSDYGKYVVNLQVTYQNTTKTLEQPYIFDLLSNKLYVTICANRPPAIDLCNPIPLSSNCNPTQNNSLVLVPTVSGGSGSYSYFWQDGSPSWNSTASVLVVPSYLNDRTYTCTVRDNTYSTRQGTAGFTLHIFKSNPGCTVNPQ